MRRAQFLGREVGQAGTTDPLSLGASSLVATTQVAAVAGSLGPEAAIAMAAVTLAIGGASLTNLYTVDGQIILPRPELSISYADLVREKTLEWVYGKDLGSKLWNSEFANRQIEIDLRAKWPG